VTQNFATLVSEVAEVIAAVSGITAAPASPSENIGRGVFALTYLMTSTTEISETGTTQHYRPATDCGSCRYSAYYRDNNRVGVL
jgi:hypothetical protein